MLRPPFNLQLLTIINEKILAYKPNYYAKYIKNMIFVEAGILLQL